MNDTRHSPLVISLEAVRTDGWFQRIGEGIGSFHALCELIGERFFAFSMITGARITAVTVDRRNPDNTLVDFLVGDGTESDQPVGEREGALPEVQRLTLVDFRRRLVGALLADEAPGPPPARETELEALQQHIGVRYLLLAPLFGYSLRTLSTSESGSEIGVLYDGVEQHYDLETFRLRIRAHVREELERAASGRRAAIDLARVADAEAAAQAGDYERVAQLLGAWPAPLALFLRTPEGQMLAPEARALIARALGLLGTACVKLGDTPQGEEVFRLAVQYAQEGPEAIDIFRRLGEALLEDGRPGEAIAPLRRALSLGGADSDLFFQLARAFILRGRFVAAFGCLREAARRGLADEALAEEWSQVENALGPALALLRTELGIGRLGRPPGAAH